MKIIPAEVKLSPIFNKTVTGNSVTAIVEAPAKAKYSSSIYELVSPCIVFAVLDRHNELEVEVRSITYGVQEQFFFPSDCQAVFIGADYGLLGGRSKPIGLGIRRAVYVYSNAVFSGTSSYLVYSQSGSVKGDRYIVSINGNITGAKALLIGEEWVIGDAYLIGGYHPEA